MHNKYQFISCSRKLSRHYALPDFLGGDIVYARRGGNKVGQVGDCVLAWGRKPSASKAVLLSEKLSLPLWRLEDGFIHSLGQGVSGAVSWSLVVDRKGIYYDATQPSELEDILAGRSERSVDLSSPELLCRAERLIGEMARKSVSKYNNAPLNTMHLGLPAGDKVLVVDQTAGDMSLQYGLAREADAWAMLQAACDEHPNATILLKTHPDVVTGHKKGCFSDADLPDQVKVITQQVNPLVLLAQVKHVYVLTSQLGFEALLLGKPVTCFGVPFYAGWGLTDDRADQSHPVFARRCLKRKLTQVFAAAYFQYSRYVHPETGERCEAEQVVEFIGEQNQHFAGNEGHLFAFGFSRWKRNYIRRFLYAPISERNVLNFVNTAQAAQRRGFSSDCHIIIWGERAIAEAEKLSADYDVPIWRVEDGFIRSAGLGSDYTPPLSLVLDKRGIYYDPAQQSDLEYLLQSTEFSADIVNRAADVRTKLLDYALSKYNLGGALLGEQVAARAGQRIVLVPGQVEDDASIRKGCRSVASNTALLQAVRLAHPTDYVIYKPHPDVISGNRKGQVSGSLLRTVCDLVLDDVSVTDCLDVADEVHTMTSLVGFEGLLRNKKVVCYGLPFYAGWGLTEDRYSLARRTRNLTLNELVAATLILYPRYMDWQCGTFTTPEAALELLRSELLEQGGKKQNKMHVLKRLWAKAVHVYHGVFTFRY